MFPCGHLQSTWAVLGCLLWRLCQATALACVQSLEGGRKPGRAQGLSWLGGGVGWTLTQCLCHFSPGKSGRRKDPRPSSRGHTAEPWSSPLCSASHKSSTSWASRSSCWTCSPSARPSPGLAALPSCPPQRWIHPRVCHPCRSMSQQQHKGFAQGREATRCPDVGRERVPPLLPSGTCPLPLLPWTILNYASLSLSLSF